MTELKATPGPWYAGNPNVSNPKRYQVWAVECRAAEQTEGVLPALQLVAHCNANGEMPPGIDEANARLIAASPMLYAALERLTYYLNGINESGVHAPTPDEMADANRQAQAALSAARGEAPGAEG